MRKIAVPASSAITTSAATPPSTQGSAPPFFACGPVPKSGIGIWVVCPPQGCCGGPPCVGCDCQPEPGMPDPCVGCACRPAPGMPDPCVGCACQPEPGAPGPCGGWDCGSGPCAPDP